LLHEPADVERLVLFTSAMQAPRLNSLRARKLPKGRFVPDRSILDVVVFVLFWTDDHFTAHLLRSRAAAKAHMNLHMFGTCQCTAYEEMLALRATLWLGAAKPYPELSMPTEGSREVYQDISHCLGIACPLRCNTPREVGKYIRTK
jgi:hypothetical protein